MIFNLILIHLNWVAVFLGITGTILNARKSIKGFYLWLPGNFVWIYLYWNKDWALVTICIIYSFITSYGIYKWKKMERNNASS